MFHRHILIENVTPSVDGGRYPAKRIVGESCAVEADIFRDGHDHLRAVIQWRKKGDVDFAEVPMALINNDRWRGAFPLNENARYEFTVGAWTDRFSSWLDNLQKWVEGGEKDIVSEIVEGIRLIENVGQRAKVDDKAALAGIMTELKAVANAPEKALRIALLPELAEIMLRLDERRDLVVFDPLLEIIADRPLAQFGAWYEMFPRSQGRDSNKGATFREAEQRLKEIGEMGFDIVYLPPIHPIGRTGRKGRNNTLECLPGDPGSPWAIGSEKGGHTAVEPSLGTLKDFDHFVEATRKLGMEVALDFALQASPDHPWVKEHPEWFKHRPDGTIKYAENPPKKYQDIYPLNFDNENAEGLWKACRDIIAFWIGHGAKIFRVDNPHTKPVRFWEWLIRDIQEKHPEVIFLSEAFTRPKMMKALAKVGFTQSYTYFTWRHTKWEFIDYLTELTRSGMEEYFRPNFFTNTPDILAGILKYGSRAAFKIRLVLAATLSPTYGIYSGFELCENEPMTPKSEEYLHSEKYEIKVRDLDAPGNLKEFIRKVNHIRRGNPALHTLCNLHFFPTDNDQLLCYGKVTEDRTNAIIVAVSFDSHSPQAGTVTVPLDILGVASEAPYTVQDLLTGAEYSWSERNYIRLDPEAQPAHIFRVIMRG